MAYALITGASNGIGLCIATELARRQYNLLIISRDINRLAQLKAEWEQQYKIKVEFLGIDLSQSGSAAKVISWASSFDVEILVNNAGFGVWGPVERNNPGDISALIHLNQLTLTELCQGFILIFKKRKSKSYILNVASTAAYQAVPLLAIYSASKAYVLSFTRALRWELKGTAISVTCLCPGTTATGFMDRAKMTDELRQKAKNVTMTPEAVARIGVKGMFAGRAEIIPGFINWLSANLVSFVPKVLTERIAFNLYSTSK